MRRVVLVLAALALIGAGLFFAMVEIVASRAGLSRFYVAWAMPRSMLGMCPVEEDLARVCDWYAQLERLRAARHPDPLQALGDVREQACSTEVLRTLSAMATVDVAEKRRLVGALVDEHAPGFRCEPLSRVLAPDGGAGM